MLRFDAFPLARSPAIKKRPWDNVIPHFEGFLTTITPSDIQFLEASKKALNVANSLYRHYYKLPTPEKNEKYIVVGSFGKNTIVRPIGDVDILFRLPDSEYSRFNGYTSNGQSSMLQEVKNILVLTNPGTEIRGDGQAVIVKFDLCHVEVVPVFWLQGKIITPNTHKGGTWNNSNPFKENNLLNAADSISGGNARDIIKMMKIWKNACNVPIKSIVIEKTASLFAETWNFRNKSMYWYDWMVRDYFYYLYGCANKTFQLPDAFDVINTGEDWISKCRTAYYNALKACEYEYDYPQISTLASGEWKKIFGDDFHHLKL